MSDDMAIPDFDADTAVALVGEHLYSATLLETWNIVAGPNGGYLAAIIARAMTESVADARRGLRSLTVHYLSRPHFDEVEIAVDVLRTGFSVSSLSATLRQGQQTICSAVAAFSVPWISPEEWPTPMPATAQDAGIELIGMEPPPFAANWQGRPIIDASFFSGEGTARVGQWIRARKDRPLDAIELVAISDALPPAGFPRMKTPGAMPTIDLTVHIRATLPLDPAPADPRVYAEFTTSSIADGFAGEDGTIWSADGTLLAQSRQLAIAR